MKKNGGIQDTRSDEDFIEDIMNSIPDSKKSPGAEALGSLGGANNGF